MIVTYAIMAFIATVLLIGYIALVRQKEPWLLLLFVCVTVVNTGYFLLSAAKTLGFAIFANDLAYFGSVFLSVSMLLTIIRLCGFKVSKKLVAALVSAAVIMFCLVATSGFLPLYYKELSLVFVDGAAKLEKVYGALHPVYLVYLLSYFAAMIACIVYSIRKKMIASQRHAALMAAIVFGNIAVWLVEKFIPWDFEFLSVSYLFSETILLGLYWMMQDYVRIDLIPAAEQTAADDTASTEQMLEIIADRAPADSPLSPREREILFYILQNYKRKDIAEQLCLSENTVKTYTRNLYSKLGVSSREQIFAMLEE